MHFSSLCPYLSSPFSLSEDEAFELRLGLQTLLELKVRSSLYLLIFCEPYRVFRCVRVEFYTASLAEMVTRL